MMEATLTDYTPRMERVLQAAAAIAGTEPVGTEHVLLALLQDERSIAAQSIAALGVSDALAERLRSTMQSEGYLTPSTVIHDN